MPLLTLTHLPGLYFTHSLPLGFKTTSSREPALILAAEGTLSKPHLPLSFITRQLFFAHITSNFGCYEVENLQGRFGKEMVLPLKDRNLLN